MPTINLRDGTRQRYLKIGRGSPVLLLHGLGLQAKHWLPFISRNLHRHCFLIPDFRGHGASFKSTIQSIHDPLDQLSEDLHEIVMHEGIDQFKLVAYSLGAVVSLRYIENFGDQKISHYMHIEAGPKFHSDDGWKLGFNQEAIILAQKLMDSFCESFDPNSEFQELPSRFKDSYRQLLWTMARISWPPGPLEKLLHRVPDIICQPWLPNWQVACSLFQHLLKEGYDHRQTVAGMKTPVTIVAAKHSQFFPPEALHWMLEASSDSQLELFTRSGHGLMYSEPIRFIRTISGFLNEA